MLQATTIARPYAIAIFKIAIENESTNLWQEVLQNLSMLIQNKDFVSLIGNPKIDKKDLIHDIQKILGESVKDLESFLNILATNKRLLVLPQISQYFNELLIKYNGSSEVLIQSAYKLTVAQKQSFVKYLEVKFNRKLNAVVKVVPELIGGIRAFVGDEVLDYSVKAHLENMKASIIA